MVPLKQLLSLQSWNSLQVGAEGLQKKNKKDSESCLEDSDTHRCVWASVACWKQTTYF